MTSRWVGVADHRDVTPGGISADLRGDHDRVLQTIPELGLAAASVYDVVVLGQAASDLLTGVNLVTRVSPPCTEVLGITGAPEDACVRLVHAAPDAPAVDAYLNDAQVAADLSCGSATGYAAVSSGGCGVRAVAAGGDTEASILNGSIDLDPVQAYEILIQGGGTDLGFNITDLPFDHWPKGKLASASCMRPPTPARTKSASKATTRISLTALITGMPPTT